MYFTYTVAPAYAGAHDAPPAPPAATQPTDGLPSHVTLADWAKPCEVKVPKGQDPGAYRTAHCDYPRAARPSTIATDSPTVSHAEFLRKYPQLGEAGYQAIATANKKLCDEGYSHLTGMSNLNVLLGLSDNEYQVLDGIYQALPDEVRHSTRVMQTSQAVSAGFLCVLSFGLYCIAAVVNAAGNIVTAETSMHLQLANIRLSIANIVLSRLSIWSSQLHLRLEELWLNDYMPFCKGMGYAPVVLPPMPPLPKLPEGFGESSSTIPPQAPPANDDGQQQLDGKRAKTS